jgi:exonuclease SbcC
MARCQAQAEAVADSLNALARKHAERLAAEFRLGTLDAAWLAWRTLAQALGRDGLPKLEIDAAGPTVSQLTNQLLEAGFGARFTVDMATQVAKADGKGLKEEFTIKVFDNAHGVEHSDIGDLSGGERVVVEEALRAGILLFNNLRQRRPIRTCWRDETTGALDPENVPRYVAMLRKMHQVGGFRHTLFVTHSVDVAAALADTVFRVRGGVPELERAA